MAPESLRMEARYRRLRGSQPRGLRKKRQKKGKTESRQGENKGEAKSKVQREPPAVFSGEVCILRLCRELEVILILNE